MYKADDDDDTKAMHAEYYTRASASRQAKKKNQQPTKRNGPLSRPPPRTGTPHGPRSIHPFRSRGEVIARQITISLTDDREGDR